MHQKITEIKKKIRKQDSLTKKELKFLKEEIERNSKIYYDDGEPDLTDDEWDMFKEEYESYEGLEPLKLGALPSKEKKTSHSVSNFLGGLEKAHTLDEADDWLHKIGLKKTHVIIVSLKADGNSIAIDIDFCKPKNTLEKVYTRGQDGEGQDYTKKFKGTCFESGQFAKERVTIKFEAVMTWNDFDDFSKVYQEETGRILSNPRNAVSGILSRDDAEKYLQYLTLIPLDIYEHSLEKQRSRLERIGLMNAYMKVKESKLPFKVKEFTFESFILKDDEIVLMNKGLRDEGSVKCFSDYYDIVKEDRDDTECIEYPIDGLVVEILGEDLIEKLGYKEVDGLAVPNFAIALKFPYKTAKTRLERFEFDLAFSNTGRITPCAVFEPVKIDGKTFTRVSLSNFSRINKEDFRVGGEVLLTLRGDVLGYINRVPNPDKSEKKLPKCELPDECPVCGGELAYNETEVWMFCQNPECPNKKIGKIQNFLEKMRIKDIAENTLSKLIESSLLDGNPIDLYKLDYKKVSKLKGFGSKSADVIKNALEERKEVFDYEFFGAWNWSGVGRSMMKKVFAEMNAKSLMKLLSEGPRVFKQRILQIPGFKDKLTGNLFKGLDDDFDEIMEFITKKYVILKESRSKKQVENSLSFVVTGTLNKYPLRDDLKMKIEAEGHSLKSSVSSKTNYVIVGKSPGKEKIAKAKELGIPIIEEKEFLNVSGL